jgi:CHASE1-domain containing sensor protein
MEGQSKKKIYFLALSLLIGLLMLNFIMRQISVTKLLDNSLERFNERSAEVVHLMSKRVDRFSDIALFGRKFFESSSFVTREEFTHFFEEYFEKRKDILTGVENVAFIEKIKDKKAFVDTIRREKTKTAFSFLYFNIQSQNPESTQYVFNYLFPHKNNTRFFGYDAADSRELRRGLTQAAEEGRQILTNEVDLFGETYMFLIDPIFDPNAKVGSTVQDALLGYMVLTIKKNEVFDKVLEYKGTESEKMNIKVFFDDMQGAAFYEEVNIDEGIIRDSSRFIKNKIPLQFANRRIMVEVETKPRLQLTEFEKVFPEINFIVSSAMVVIFFVIMITFRTRCESTDPNESRTP